MRTWFAGRLMTAVYTTALLFAVSSTTAGAAGNKLQGFLVTRPASVTETTGSCQCDWRWYTMGLRPGAFRATLTLRENGPPMAPSYSVIAYLLRNNHEVASTTVTCDRRHPRCGRRSTLTYSVSTPGVYYLQVHGEGSNGMLYAIHFGGSFYRLQCSKYCS